MYYKTNLSLNWLAKKKNKSKTKLKNINLKEKNVETYFQISGKARCVAKLFNIDSCCQIKLAVQKIGRIFAGDNSPNAITFK